MADAGWHDEDAPRIDVSAFGEVPGSVTVPGPDPDRDRRVDAYRDRERRRAARALDRYIEVIIGDAAVSVVGDRFVEAIGDYVLARLAESSDRDVAFNLQHKSHYGVSGVAPAMKGKWQLWMHECGHVEHWEEGTAPADGGCDACESGSNNASDWRPLYTDMQEGRPEWTPDEQHNADSGRAE